MPVPLPDFPGARTGWRRWLRAALPASLAVVGLLALTNLSGRPEGAPEPPPVGLPGGRHLHALAVDPGDASRIFLGTHFGVYASDDAGSSWEVAGVEGKDVLDLAVTGDAIWAAGVDALVRSRDGGATWREVRAEGLPNRRVRALALHRDGVVVWVAVADAGIFVSQDAGATFELLSGAIGPDVEALAPVGAGGLLAADRERGLLLDRDGDGRGWVALLEERVRGIAATRGGYPVFLTTAGGVARIDDVETDVRHVLSINEGAGPISRSSNDATVLYAVGLDRRVYRSGDGGRTWSQTE